MICRVLDKFHLPKLKGICALVLFPLCRVDSFFSLVSFLQIKYVNQEEMTTLYNVRVVAKAPPGRSFRSVTTPDSSIRLHFVLVFPEEQLPTCASND